MFISVCGRTSKSLQPNKLSILVPFSIDIFLALLITLPNIDYVNNQETFIYLNKLPPRCLAPVVIRTFFCASFGTFWPATDPTLAPFSRLRWLWWLYTHVWICTLIFIVHWWPPACHGLWPGSSGVGRLWAWGANTTWPLWWPSWRGWHISKNTFILITEKILVQHSTSNPFSQLLPLFLLSSLNITYEKSQVRLTILTAAFRTCKKYWYCKSRWHECNEKYRKLSHGSQRIPSDRRCAPRMLDTETLVQMHVMGVITSSIVCGCWRNGGCSRAVHCWSRRREEGETVRYSRKVEGRRRKARPESSTLERV